ncbi:hypothetical protein K432DRAFT_349527 [Lepidopterella palustris CBS 459.81]|uniref:DUF3405 domain-containing protein n=1 Tax=Lepidopterella palustris CBS 459.81 TaxID=1314670 RepID=A0A8E2JH15_9PEZI|nr:hypothetical protein K432DRAFT_349527 [Lepidopterella palustris CBS 459.81]
MLLRSPRGLALLSFVAFIVVLALLRQLPYANNAAYNELPLSYSAPGAYTPDPKAQESAAPVVVEEPESSPSLEASKPSAIESPALPKTTNIYEYMKEMLKWNRPNGMGTHHWPHYQEYETKEYDPNRWEAFDMDHRMYDHGLEQLEKSSRFSLSPYLPYPEYNSPEWQKQWRGEYVACKGARGVPLNMSEDDQIHAYRGLPKGFPEVMTGGFEVVGIEGDVCFDRYSRYGPYGFTDEDAENVTDWTPPENQPVWKDVRWGALQEECVQLNKDRYRPDARNAVNMKPSIEFPSVPITNSTLAVAASRTLKHKAAETSSSYHSRTAVLIRAWGGYKYEENDITAIRAMVTELSLQSGGEYQVFLYVHIKDLSKPIFNDPSVYDEVLRANVPRELRDITILWSEAIFPTWYPKVTDWQVYWHQFMCLQFFSLTHPEFDYIWNWETDARYTGQHYHFLEKITEFATKQPRKLLWERNKRFYLPAAHGSYSSFIQDTHATVLSSYAASLIPEPIWGPRPYLAAEPPQKPVGPTPPRKFEEDDFEWGVGEPADFITLLPIWDPRNTSWSYKDKIWNYIPGVHPIFNQEHPADDKFTHPDFKHIERRAYINTVVRFSKKLLLAMHNENLVGRSMQAEMWPSTVALQHGLKAVYAPHPIYADRFWPPEYADAIYNAHSTIDETTGAALYPIPGAWGEQADSPYNHDREYNFQSWSWYYASRFPRVLYRRWLGWKVKVHEYAMPEEIVGGKEYEEKSGRMCLPGMLLHPVKKMGKDKQSL